MKEIGMYLRVNNGSENLEEVMRFVKQIFVVFLATMIIMLVGIQLGKYTEAERLKKLGLYPTNAEFVEAENWVYKYKMGERIKR